jgi:hypothetical protein
MMTKMDGRTSSIHMWTIHRNGPILMAMDSAITSLERHRIPAQVWLETPLWATD